MVTSKTGRQVNNRQTVKFNPRVPRITSRWIDAQVPIFLDFGEDSLWHIPVEVDIWAKHASVIPKSELLRAFREKQDPMAYLFPVQPFR